MADWHDRLRRASFRGVPFHVELGTHASGRRIALHEFPKRDTPYAEDMGRRSRKHAVTAYLVGPDYIDRRAFLIAALEADGPGTLVHPTLGEFQVVCDGFNAVERRERGGFVEVECTFVEAGSKDTFTGGQDTQAAVRKAAGEVEKATVESLDRQMQQFIKAGPR